MFLCGIFKGFENIFTEEFNNELINEVSKLNPQNMISINELKEKYVEKVEIKKYWVEELM